MKWLCIMGSFNRRSIYRPRPLKRLELKLLSNWPSMKDELLRPVLVFVKRTRCEAIEPIEVSLKFLGEP